MEKETLKYDEVLSGNDDNVTTSGDNEQDSEKGNYTKTKVLVLISAILVQLCAGIPYIWSVFQTGIADSLFQSNNTYASLTFSIFFLVIGFGGIIGGKIANKKGTNIAVLFGGIIASIGFTYSTTISCAQRWFVGKEGLITGIIVSAIGVSGLIFTPIIESLITAFGGQGVGEQPTFMIISAITLVFCGVGSLFLKNPPANLSAKKVDTTKKQYTIKEMMKNYKFYIIAVALMFACVGGLMMIGFAKPIAEGKGMAEIASVAVLVISLSNAGGRLLWGFVGDKIGRTLMIVILTVFSAIFSMLVGLCDGAMIFVMIGLVAFCYGGLLSNFPVITAEIFGSKNAGINYGVVLVGFGIGCVASSFIGGHYKDLAVNDISLMTPAFVIAGICALIGGALITILLVQDIKKKKANKELNNDLENK